MKTRAVIQGIIKRMLSNETSKSGLQICLVIIASIAVPPVFTHMVLTPILPAIQKEPTTVCRAPQGAMLPISNINASPVQLCNADDDWTPFSYVTAKADTSSYVEGVASIRLEIEDDFNTGLIASKDIAGNPEEWKLSDFTHITFWIKSNMDLGDDIIQLRLYENADKAGIAGCFAIPGSVLDGDSWKKATLSLAGTGINTDFTGSIALYAAQDPGELILWLDIVELTSSIDVLELPEFHLNELVYAPVKGAILAAG